MVALLVAHVGHGDHDGRAALPAWHTMVAAREGSRAGLPWRADTPAPSVCTSASSPTQPAPSIDVLVEQRFLRKKYKDPITNDDFQMLGSGAKLPGQTAGREPRARASRLSKARARRRAAADRPCREPLGSCAGLWRHATRRHHRRHQQEPAESRFASTTAGNVYNQWVFMPVARAAAPVAGVAAGGRGGRRALTAAGPRRARWTRGRGRGPQGVAAAEDVEGRRRGGPQGGGRARQVRGGLAPPRGRF